MWPTSQRASHRDMATIVSIDTVAAVAVVAIELYTGFELLSAVAVVVD